jgi:hypothetical protein
MCLPAVGSGGGVRGSGGDGDRRRDERAAVRVGRQLLPLDLCVSHNEQPGGGPWVSVQAGLVMGINEEESGWRWSPPLSPDAVAGARRHFSPQGRRRR